MLIKKNFIIIKEQYPECRDTDFDQVCQECFSVPRNAQVTGLIADISDKLYFPLRSEDQ
jgi:hypothetical protein